MEKKEDVTDDEIILLQNIKKAKKSQCIQDKIKLQIEEIFKIKKVIAEFQEIHTDQKNMLIKLKEELKTVLTDDEINELNSIDHNGLEDANEDSTMPEDTDLRIVQSHSAGNENRKREVSQEYMENEIEEEMFDKLSLDSWSSQNMTVSENNSPESPSIQALRDEMTLLKNENRNLFMAKLREKELRLMAEEAHNRFVRDSVAFSRFSEALREIHDLRCQLDEAKSASMWAETRLAEYLIRSALRSSTEGVTNTQAVGTSAEDRKVVPSQPVTNSRRRRRRQKEAAIKRARNDEDVISSKVGLTLPSPGSLPTEFLGLKEVGAIIAGTSNAELMNLKKN